MGKGVQLGGELRGMGEHHVVGRVGDHAEGSIVERRHILKSVLIQGEVPPSSHDQDRSAPRLTPDGNPLDIPE